jgi:hypothetical protein
MRRFLEGEDAARQEREAVDALIRKVQEDDARAARERAAAREATKVPCASCTAWVVAQLCSSRAHACVWGSVLDARVCRVRVRVCATLAGPLRRVSPYTMWGAVRKRRRLTLAAPRAAPVSASGTSRSSKSHSSGTVPRSARRSSRRSAASRRTRRRVRVERRRSPRPRPRTTPSRRRGIAPSSRSRRRSDSARRRKTATGACLCAVSVCRRVPHCAVASPARCVLGGVTVCFTVVARVQVAACRGGGGAASQAG